uniref:Putative lipocalin-2 1 n=1 Tax=Ixodes ricinus TaxID=34613 RepID=V5H4L4_IXORI
MKLAILSLLIFFLAIHVEAQPGDRRIDEEETYWQHQDIRKALENTDKKSWMLYRTLRTTNRAKNKCVYAEVKETRNRRKVFTNFVQKYKKEDGTKKEQTLFAFPYKTEPTGYEEREKDNGMLVKEDKESENGRHYVLIYSDYTCCDILRALHST